MHEQEPLHMLPSPVERLSESDLHLFNHLNARAQVLQAGMNEIQAAVNVLLAPYKMQSNDTITDDGMIVRADHG